MVSVAKKLEVSLESTGQNPSRGTGIFNGVVVNSSVYSGPQQHPNLPPLEKTPGRGTQNVGSSLSDWIWDL